MISLDDISMLTSDYKVGDTVRVLRVPPSVEQEMPQETVQLFRQCVGKILRIDGFGRYGHLEFRIADDRSQTAERREHTIWLEPEFVEAVSDYDATV